jgi:hypothetical protein
MTPKVLEAAALGAAPSASLGAALGAAALGAAPSASLGAALGAALGVAVSVYLN